MTILVLPVLGKISLPLVKAADVSTVIYAKLQSDCTLADLPSHIRTVYAYTDLRKTISYAFSQMHEQLTALQKRVPDLFHYRGYDLTHAMEKEVFWGLFEDYAIERQVKLAAKPGDRVVKVGRRSTVVARFALMRRLFFGGEQVYDLKVPAIIDSSVIAFRINHAGSLEHLGNLLQKLPAGRLLAYQTDPRAARAFAFSLKKIFNDNLEAGPKKIRRSKLSVQTRLRMLFKRDADFINVVAVSAFRMINHADQYEKLFRAGLKKVFVLAAENEGEGNIMHLAAKKFGAVTFNYANGTKADDPQNRNTWFDYWFMPNESTASLIGGYGRMDSRQLPVTGHLLQEVALQHAYTGSLETFEEQLNGKRVIALFTSIFYVREREDVVEFLARYLDMHPDLVVLVRRHPRESENISVSHPRMIVLPVPVKADLNTSLFDLLLRSSAAITFTSTTSLQASWFNILSVNFEYSPEPKLPHVDDIHVHHADSVQKLRSLLDSWLASSRIGNKSKSESSASENIASIVLAA